MAHALVLVASYSIHYRSNKGQGETPMTSDFTKRTRCKAVNKATCDHYDYPIWMMALGGKYQARCLGCETVGPIVSAGPWAAEQALYFGRARSAKT
jgi:hypothetical protein